jgi:hypothetical protein
MADDKQGRDEQANREQERQRERMQEEAVTRADETEPTGGDLGALGDALDSHDYPATTTELIEAYGEYDIEIRDGEQTLADVLASVDDELYDSADDARSEILNRIV